VTKILMAVAVLNWSDPTELLRYSRLLTADRSICYRLDIKCEEMAANEDRCRTDLDRMT